MPTACASGRLVPVFRQPFRRHIPNRPSSSSSSPPPSIKDASPAGTSHRNHHLSQTLRQQYEEITDIAAAGSIQHRDPPVPEGYTPYEFGRRGFAPGFLPPPSTINHSLHAEPADSPASLAFHEDRTRVQLKSLQDRPEPTDPFELFRHRLKIRQLQYALQVPKHERIRAAQVASPGYVGVNPSVGGIVGRKRWRKKLAVFESGGKQRSVFDEEHFKSMYRSAMTKFSQGNPPPVQGSPFLQLNTEMVSEHESGVEAAATTREQPTGPLGLKAQRERYENHPLYHSYPEIGQFFPNPERLLKLLGLMNAAKSFVTKETLDDTIDGVLEKPDVQTSIRVWEATMGADNNLNAGSDGEVHAVGQTTSNQRDLGEAGNGENSEERVPLVAQQLAENQGHSSNALFMAILKGEEVPLTIDAPSILSNPGTRNMNPSSAGASPQYYAVRPHRTLPEVLEEVAEHGTSETDLSNASQLDSAVRAENVAFAYLGRDPSENQLGPLDDVTPHQRNVDTMDEVSEEAKKWMPTLEGGYVRGTMRDRREELRDMAPPVEMVLKSMMTQDTASLSNPKEPKNGSGTGTCVETSG